MAVVIPLLGAKYLLHWLFRRPLIIDTSTDLLLYRNDYAPGLNSVLSDFDYGAGPFAMRRQILDTDWSEPIVIGSKVQSQCGQGSFIFNHGSPPQTVFGYLFAERVGPGVVLYAEKFPGPLVCTSGVPFDLVVKWSFGGCGF